MIKELIIQSGPKGVDVALLEDKKLVEYHQDKNSNQFTVGDVFLGRVKKIIPGLNAAFVDIGSEKDAFLHYTDLSPQLKNLLRFTSSAVAGSPLDISSHSLVAEPEIPKEGKIGDFLKAKDLVLVQILKEPISSKGPRLSCEISIAGRNLILTPFGDAVGVSKKIGSVEERKRLKVLLESLKPKNISIVVRTVAEGKNASLLHDEILSLTETWKLIGQNLRLASAPKKIHSELDKSSSILRDILNDTFSNVATNSSVMSKELESYVVKIAPDKKNIVNFYEGKSPIFDHYGITKQVKSAFGKTVTLDSGAYIVVEHTEALHVIDVNSGHKMSMNGNQESVALSVNMEAATEIARQLRLRDMGGIIVVDFIDMKLPANRQTIFELVKTEMLRDRATHSVQPLTKLNLLQITRERVKPQTTIITTETCSACGGSGKVNSSILIVDDIERNVKFLNQTHQKLSLTVHPYIHAFLTKGIFNSTQMNWFWNYKKWIPVRSNNNASLNEYHFYDGRGEEIRL